MEPEEFDQEEESEVCRPLIDSPDYLRLVERYQGLTEASFLDQLDPQGQQELSQVDAQLRELEAREAARRRPLMAERDKRFDEIAAEIRDLVLEFIQDARRRERA
jgi:hypothetical protein